MKALVRRAVLALPLLAACGRRAEGESRIEREVRTGLGTQLAARVDAVDCPGGPPPLTCEAKVGEARLHVWVAPAGSGQVAWDLIDLVVAAPPLEAYLRAALGELGVEGKADCGARVRVAKIGDRIECSLGKAGAAWATVLDDDGVVSVELALGDDGVRVRTEAVDVAGLDELSRALDLEPTAEEEAGDQDTADGGAR